MKRIKSTTTISSLAVLVLFSLPTLCFAEDFDTMPTSKLIEALVAIQDELAERDVASSGNGLTGQLGEFLFIQSFGWTKAETNQKGFDALDSQKRIQIKARRISESAGSEQLGAIRDLDGFDLLAAVLFDHHYKVVEAALIPSKVVSEVAEFDSYTNSWRLNFSEELRGHPSVIDVSSNLKELKY